MYWILYHKHFLCYCTFFRKLFLISLWYSMNHMHTLTVNNIVSSNSCAKAAMQRAHLILAWWLSSCPQMSVIRSLRHTNICRMWLCGGCSERAYQCWREKKGRQTRRAGVGGGEAVERNPQAESSSDSIAFAASLSLFVQNWKCDILKLVFIETNIRWGESSRYL